MDRRNDREVVGAAGHGDRDGPLRSRQLGVELVGAAGDLELAELRVAEIEVQIRCPALDLDRPGDLVRERDGQVTAISAKEMEGRKTRALADLQGAGLAVEADRRRILTTRIVDLRLVERVTETAGRDIDGRGAVV